MTDTSGIIRNQAVTEGKLELAKGMRQGPTEAESLLWERLRNRKLNGLKFRRQQLICGFIADFYCDAHRLVVELDGAGHNEESQKAADAERTLAFQARGIRVIRFYNRDVLAGVESVLRQIAERTIAPSPAGEGAGFQQG